MIPSLDEGLVGSCGAYIDAVSGRQATPEPATGDCCRRPTIERYDNFTKMNLI
jgi:hypothetical protein